jgi:hypothetical protein
MAGKHLINNPFTTGIYEHVHTHPHLKRTDVIIYKFLLENVKNCGISPTDICLQGFYLEEHSYATED